MSVTHSAAGGDKNPQLIKMSQRTLEVNEETKDGIHTAACSCCFTCQMLFTWFCTVTSCTDSPVTASQSDRTSTGCFGLGVSPNHRHHHQICAFTVRKLTWCLLNHSCFPLWLQRCPLGRVLSAPSPTSSVSGKSPEQQQTPLSCGKAHESKIPS